MGTVIHRLVGLACIRKLIEQARKNNPISSLHPHLCFNSCLKVIVWVPALTSNINTPCYKTVSQINTFSLKLFLVSMFITATEGKLEYCLGSELQRLLQRHMWIHLIMYANYFLSNTCPLAILQIYSQQDGLCTSCRGMGSRERCPEILRAGIRYVGGGFEGSWVQRMTGLCRWQAYFLGLIVSMA